MYDLIDIIDIKLSGMDRLIHRWMTNHQLIKSTLLHDIKSIKMTINKYHKKYVICKEWENYGRCKYGTYCWNLHPLNNNNNNNINNNNNSNNSNKQKRKENKQKISEKINFPEFSDKNENGHNNSIVYCSDNNNSFVNYSEDEYYDTENDNDSSDDSDYNDDNENYQEFSQKQKFQEFSHQNNEQTFRNSDNGNKREVSPDYQSVQEFIYHKKESTYRNYDNGNQCDSSQGFQPVKRKKKKKKKKSKKWRKKEAVKKEIAQAKNFFCNKEKLQKMIAKTDNKHIKYLIQHYKQPICFKYMNGRCNDSNCTFKHPRKCDNYKHNNGYMCKYGDQCWFAHINFKQQPNGKIVTNYENMNKNNSKKDNSKNSNNNDNKLNNNNNKNYAKIENDLEQRVQELKKEKYSVVGVTNPNFNNIGKLSDDKTYCEAAKETENKQDSNMNEETKDNNNKDSNNNNKNDNDNNMDEKDNKLPFSLRMTKDVPQCMTLEFATEVVCRKLMKKNGSKGTESCKKIRKLEREHKARVIDKMMTEQTDLLYKLLWINCKGKIELIENYFDTIFEYVEQKYEALENGE